MENLDNYSFSQKTEFDSDVAGEIARWTLRVLKLSSMNWASIDYSNFFPSDDSSSPDIIIFLRT